MRKEFAPETMSKLFSSFLKRSLLYEERVCSRNYVKIVFLLSEKEFTLRRKNLLNISVKIVYLHSEKEFTLRGKSLFQQLCQYCLHPL